MRYYLLFTLLLLFCVYSVNAQCNPKEYTRIFNEASALQEKGEFIDAKNRYEAAKIYACGQKEKDAADGRVDALFEQMDFLRNLADSIASAAQRAARRAYSNGLVYKSQTALRDGDRTTAFRLAEFAHSYVDAENPSVTNILFEILNYNEVSDRIPLVWNFNLCGHTSVVKSVVFSPDGKRLASASDDGTVKIWDLSTQKAILTIKKYTCSVVFSPDGNYLVTESFDSAEIWDLKTGKPILTLNGHKSRVVCVAFSLDGTRLATGSLDKTVIIWDVKNGNPIHTIQISSPVSSVAFSSDNKLIATGSSDKSVKIFDLGTDNMVFSFEEGSSIQSVIFSPNCELLASVSMGKTVKIWELKTGKNIWTLAGHSLTVNCASFSPDSKMLATGSDDRTAKIWDLSTGSTIQTLIGHTSKIQSVAFSQNGKQLATGSVDNTAKIWDLAKIIPRIEKYSRSDSWAISKDRKKIASFQPGRPQNGMIDNTAKIWDIETGKLIRTFEGHTSVVRCVAFSIEGDLLATGSEDNTAKIWNIKTGREIQTFKHTAILNTAVVNCVSFSSDSKKVATGAWDNVARIWDIEIGIELRTFKGHAAQILTLSFSPDGKRLATGSADNTAKIWDLDTGMLIYTFNGHTSSVINVVFSPDGKRLATESDDNSSKIWDLETGKEMLTLKGYNSVLGSISFSTDRFMIMEMPYDKMDKVWDINKDSIIWKLHQQRPLASLTLTQISSYGYDLEELLDMQDGNEEKICTTKEIWQIAAFADLYFRKILEVNKPNVSDYKRANRLYQICIEYGGDPSYFREKLNELNKVWKEKTK